MKIPGTLTNYYEEIHPVLERMREFVKPRILEVSNKYNASYIDRIKSIESILVKAEKEGLEFPLSQINDLFGCAVIVPNSKHISIVSSEIESLFVVVQKRQRALKPIEFDYNDLNLTLKISSRDVREDDPIRERLFEVQIKTLLQEAWSKAGHDIIYKAKKKTWGITRVASQLRALLEMADAVLANLEVSATVLQEQKEYEQFAKVNQVIDFFESYWPKENQPPHAYRTAQIVEDYLGYAQLTLSDFETLLQSDKYTAYLQARTLTPTQAIFIILYLEKGGQFVNRFGNRKVLITDEMIDLCPELRRVALNKRMNFETVSIPVT
jgi:ppGpp synthetase/RelA/SpoT-type nucleotidyltranferase